MGHGESAIRDHIRGQVQVGVTKPAVGGWNERSNLQVVEAICGLVDEIAPDAKIGPRAKLITFVADRPGHDKRYAIDASKIKRDLGWKPRESFASGSLVCRKCSLVATYPLRSSTAASGSAKSTLAKSIPAKAMLFKATLVKSHDSANFGFRRRRATRPRSLEGRR